MAKCTYKLPDEFLKKLSTLGKNTDAVATKMLKKGGEVVLENTRSNLVSVVGKNTEEESRSTGQLVASLGLSPVLVGRNGDYNIKVGFSENRTDGKSNAMIANIIEYGKFNQPARPFLKPAKTKSKNEVIKVMEQTFEEEIKKL